MTLEAIRLKYGKLQILDQLLLPHSKEYIEINSIKDGWNAINKMQVQGSSAIGILGCLSLAMELEKNSYESKEDLFKDVKEKLEYLSTARPTDVSIKLAAKQINKKITILSRSTSSLENSIDVITSFPSTMLDIDVEVNKAIGDYGADEILRITKSDKPLRLITHCNTGSLATAGYGTALGVIRSLLSKGKLEQVYCTETRPYNEGARFTAYELVHDKIPGILICDDMVAALMKTTNISAVVVGADRIAANGDIANKIGTYQLAILCKFHNIPFYVAAPFITIDFDIKDGSDIKIEERPEFELTHINGLRIAAEGIGCWNPEFDVTPANLITGIITEKGVHNPQQLMFHNLTSDCINESKPNVN